jgi:hypothetical protein
MQQSNTGPVRIASSRRYMQCQVRRADHHEDKDDDKPGISFPPVAASGHFPFAMLQSESVSHVNARIAKAMLDFCIRYGLGACLRLLFSEARLLKALDEMYRVLRPSGKAVIVDLGKDTSIDEIDAYVNQSGRRHIDAWMTKWTVRQVQLKRASQRMNSSAWRRGVGSVRVRSILVKKQRHARPPKKQGIR